MIKPQHPTAPPRLLGTQDVRQRHRDRIEATRDLCAAHLDGAFRHRVLAQIAEEELAPDTLVLGRYSIVERVGEGAFGRVYRARDESGGTVALKELSPPGDDDPALTVRLFRREVATLLRLDHPAIPAVHAASFGGPFYLAMDYVEGPTLERVLDDRGPIDWHQAAEWGVRLASALAYLHEQQPPILFRDLKPANVIIEAASNEPRLIDFGIARTLDVRSGQTLLGTPGYAPIEQWLGRADAASDQYALGATLHDVVSGTKASHALARLQAEGADVPTAMGQLFSPLENLVPGVPADFSTAVTRATAPAPEERYPDVTAFSVALGESLVAATARTLEAIQA
jgi:serine/threonine protein kinase